MSRVLPVLIALASGLWLAASPAAAVILFEDSFDRSASNTVGGPTGFPSWAEIEKDASDVAIVGNNVMLRDIRPTAPDASITMSGLSTVGYEDLKLIYSWRGSGTEAGEIQILYVLWKRSADLNFVEVNQHDLITQTFSQVNVSLGTLARNTTIDISFVIDVTDFSDAARLDFVRLEGTAIPPPVNLSEPSTFLVFAAVLSSLLFWRRRLVA